MRHMKILIEEAVLEMWSGKEDYEYFRIFEIEELYYES